MKIMNLIMSLKFKRKSLNNRTTIDFILNGELKRTKRNYFTQRDD